MNLSHINELEGTEAEEAFLKCCGSRRWASEMALHRPFHTPDELLHHAERVWARLDETDWLEAFDAHPKIGDVESLKKKYGATRNWSENEQSGVSSAEQSVIEDLAKQNSLYEERFGFIFIVCATGKSAAEMLEILNSRINNSRSDELTNAGAEQKKITCLRLEKL
ncbi:MAG: 2-oxo-4-hydroxy-4-carboxy-5-ureidoimidazoline decarboxylase [Cyanobacteria bacterium]|nr:2-oxo-4-hydroxy-4-carboxy-5-ureidoimidazoline decarboxylase [Cyanobacteriota bacterium]